MGKRILTLFIHMLSSWYRNEWYYKCDSNFIKWFISCINPVWRRGYL